MAIIPSKLGTATNNPILAFDSIPAWLNELAVTTNSITINKTYCGAIHYSTCTKFAPCRIKSKEYIALEPKTPLAHKFLLGVFEQNFSQGNPLIYQTTQRSIIASEVLKTEKYTYFVKGRPIPVHRVYKLVRILLNCR